MKQLETTQLITGRQRGQEVIVPEYLRTLVLSTIDRPITETFSHLISVQYVRDK